VEEEIKTVYSDIDIVLIEGSGGIFEVVLEEEILFSKRDLIGTDTKRFPYSHELSDRIREQLGVCRINPTNS